MTKLEFELYSFWMYYSCGPVPASLPYRQINAVNIDLANHLRLLLTLGANAQQGLQQLSCVSVCLCVCLLPLFQQTEQ